MKINLKLIEQSETQSSLYQPGFFWKKATSIILNDLNENGIESFRRLPSSLSFFVPTYGYPGNALSEKSMQSLEKWSQLQNLNNKQETYLKQFTSGYSAALADYRTLAASEYGSTTLPNLLEFSESQVGEPIEQFNIEDSYYSRSALNYLTGLSFLKKYNDISNFKTVIEIGGGFGTLGEILHQVLPNVQYIDIDIPPTLFCAEYYLKNTIGTEHVSTYEDIKEHEEIKLSTLKKASILPSWTIEKLQGNVDLFVNFISFQEMEPHIVKNYLDNVIRLQAKWILLRNLREGKQIRSQNRLGVQTPIFSEDYTHMLPNYKLVETNVYPYGFKTVDGFHSEIMLFKRL